MRTTVRYLHDNGDARMHPCPRYSLISRYHIPARINENIAFLIEFAPPRCATVREREEGGGGMGKGGKQRFQQRCTRWSLSKDQEFFDVFNHFSLGRSNIIILLANFFIISLFINSKLESKIRFRVIGKRFECFLSDRSIGKKSEEMLRSRMYVFFSLFFFSSCERIDLKAQRKSRVHPWGPGR